MFEDRKVKGLLGTKLGMTQLWDENNRVVPVTVVQAGPCVVTQVRTPATDGYSAVQLGFGAVKAKQLTKPSAGHFEKAGVTPRKHLVEIRTNDASEYSLGQELTAEVFAADEVLDVTGVSKGKGTAGVMKRHGFGGLRASHGVHRKHRSPGSIGGCATPGRVFKGLRMAGRMGVDRVTVQNLTVHAVDAERGLILIKGAIPGVKGALVVLRSARQEGRAGMSTIDVLDASRQQDRHGRPAGGAVRRHRQHPADPPGRGGPAGRGPPGHARHQGAGARYAVAAGSRTARRAPAALVRAPPGHRSTSVAASCTARSRAATPSARPRR